MELEEYFKKGKVIDKNEITVVIEKDKYNEDNIIGIEEGWKILTFDMLQTFGLTGFLAKLAKVLAEDRISIFVISAYSTDHILVKEEDLFKAKEKLKELGCLVQIKK